MLKILLSLILLAEPGLSDARAHQAATAITIAIRETRRVMRAEIDPAVIVAIAWTESRFDARACRDESNGSSSRGLFQVNVPRSRCGDGHHEWLYDATKNAREGVRIYVTWLRARHSLEGALRGYSGGSDSYASAVLATARRIGR